MNKLEGILFDCDGTLIDTYDIILTSMRHTVCGLMGLTCSDAELLRGVGTPLQDQMRYFLNLTGNASDDEVDKMVALYRNHNDAIHDEGVRSFPGVREALEILQDAGFKMGVVTSKRHFMADRGLEICGIRDFFDVLIGSDDFPLHKPDAGPILEGCRLLGIDAKHCAYVGDSPYDIQAANAADTLSIAALWGMFPKDVLLDQDPDVAIGSIDELPSVVETIR